MPSRTHKAAARLAPGAALLLAALSCHAQTAVPQPHPCRVEASNYRGWKAQQIVNDWVSLTIVPQLGGRLMQVAFGGHAYLFVSPRYAGQYICPSEAATQGRWINYGGDKLWPLPEGTQDEQHWPGPLSDPLDDGDYSCKVLAQGARCAVRLDGPADPRTGLQYARGIALAADSPEISFHAIMKNANGHPIRWSLQSVSQYDTADANNSAGFNHDFWAFTANSHSGYPGGYRVRNGLANDPSFSIKDGLFTLHWLDLQSEVWVDSPGDCVAVIDAATRYAMLERFSYSKLAEYSGEASVIFYKNGPPPERKQHDGEAAAPPDPDDSFFYMEAELNSPLIRRDPGARYAMDTEWLPARIGSDFKSVSDAGLIAQPLHANATNSGILLTGSFGVFFPGELVAHLYDANGTEGSPIALQSVNPTEPLTLHQEIKPPRAIARVSLHLIDPQGRDRGSLGEARLASREGGA